MVTCLAHVYYLCVETQFGWSSSVNDLCPSRRLELIGAGGQLGSMTAWEHYNRIPDAHRAQVLTDTTFAQK